MMLVALVSLCFAVATLGSTISNTFTIRAGDCATGTLVTSSAVPTPFTPDGATTYCLRVTINSDTATSATRLNFYGPISFVDDLAAPAGSALTSSSFAASPACGNLPTPDNCQVPTNTVVTGLTQDYTFTPVRDCVNTRPVDFGIFTLSSGGDTFNPITASWTMSAAVCTLE